MLKQLNFVNVSNLTFEERKQVIDLLASKETEQGPIGRDHADVLIETNDLMYYNVLVIDDENDIAGLRGGPKVAGSILLMLREYHPDEFEEIQISDLY